MHDPLTVLFEIRYPWRHLPKAMRAEAYNPNFRMPFVTVWHRDPCIGGGDDSCYRAHRAGTGVHPVWHFWHWHIQVWPLLNFKRWAFSRCGTCGGRFRWGYNPITNSWDSAGPRWFHGEPDVHHAQCHHQTQKGGLTP